MSPMSTPDELFEPTPNAPTLAEGLPATKLCRLVNKIQQLLFLDEEERDGVVFETWDPNKEHSIETVDAIIALYREYGLAPPGVTLGDK